MSFRDQTQSWTSPQLPSVLVLGGPKPSLSPQPAGRKQKGLPVLVTLKRFRTGASTGVQKSVSFAQQAPAAYVLCRHSFEAL